MDPRLWLYRLVKRAFPHGRRVAPITRLPGLGWLLQRWLFRGDDIYYVPPDALVSPAPKRRTLRVSRNVELPQDTVLPSQVVERFVRKATHRWIMNECICRASEGCSDYPIELGCLFLGEAASRIHPSMGRPVTEEEALAHLRRCREAGLVHLIGRNKLDTLWLGVGPADQLMTICHCCPCCCLWRLRPRLAPAIGRTVTGLPGVDVRVTGACAGCGDCVAVCFVDAVRLDGDGAHITDACVGCGRCVTACPQGAIELRISGQPVDECETRLDRVVDVASGGSRSLT